MALRRSLGLVVVGVWSLAWAGRSSREEGGGGGGAMPSGDTLPSDGTLLHSTCRNGTVGQQKACTAKNAEAPCAAEADERVVLGFACM